MGTNEASRTRKEVLLRELEQLGTKFKSRIKKVIISGLLPELRAHWHEVEKIRELNVWLKDWRESGFEFVGHWHQHWRRRALFRRDRLNLNSVGSRVLANRITRLVQSIKLNIGRGEQIGNEWMKLNGRRMQERLGRKADVIGQKV